MKPKTPSTLANFVENLVFINPQEVISTFRDEINVYTLNELNNRANLLAKGLLYNGVTKGTPVALVLAGTTNCLTFVIALAKIGAVLVPVNKDAGLKTIQVVLKEQKIHTIGFYADAFLKKFSEIIPDYTQSERGYLKADKFPELKNIVTFGSIKNRGIFTTRELMLLGEHMDDIEMEALIQDSLPDDTFIKQVIFDENGKSTTTSITHGELLEMNKTFPSLQSFLLNLI